MTTEERLEKVEQKLADAECRNRWLLTVVGLFVVGLGLIWILTKANAIAATTPKEIHAKSFVVDDDNGKPRILLSVGKGEPFLTMTDRNGKIRFYMIVGKEGPTMSLLNENGKPRAQMASINEGTGILIYNDNNEVIWKAP